MLWHCHSLMISIALLPSLDVVLGRGEQRPQLVRPQTYILQVLEKVRDHAVVGHSVDVDIEVAVASEVSSQRFVVSRHPLPSLVDGLQHRYDRLDLGLGGPTGQYAVYVNDPPLVLARHHVSCDPVRPPRRWLP